MATLPLVMNSQAGTKSAGGCCTSRRNSGRHRLIEDAIERLILLLDEIDGEGDERL